MSGIAVLSVEDLAQALQQRANEIVLLDVREKWEYEVCCIPNSVHIPMQQVPDRINELDRNKDTIVICHHGVRSYRVALFLKNFGFQRLYNLTGGIDAWAKTVDPNMAVY